MSKKVTVILMPCLIGGIIGSAGLGWILSLVAAIGIGSLWFLADAAIDYKARNR
ncbi:uncharacterized membrane protein (UPF0136 family) [Stakelama sediminis]|uniref:Uncharacterized membrane protein (UPF0136 family) n=1 Tax=Stakelama sediminis TaxID=463200 RepID=A0A840YVI5_9SPHN|nr:hypothetical protein [Stakelama sediminis]MBB5717559.1 uncharacterized membrane protein (UPF0136 family) [Stakelama sediminis]